MSELTYRLRGVRAELVEVDATPARNGGPLALELSCNFGNGTVERAAEERARVEHALDQQEAHLLINVDRSRLVRLPLDALPQGDLAVVAAICDWSDAKKRARLDWEGVRWAFAGELRYDGGVGVCRGILPFALAAKQAGVTDIVVPSRQAQEAAACDGVRVHPVATLTDLLRTLIGAEDDIELPRSWEPSSSNDLCYSDVLGQRAAMRAMEIAAAGRHNLLLVGPPGTAKTMMARRAAALLPPISREEALETTAVYSARGLVQEGSGLLMARPFRAPHHTGSTGALVGSRNNGVRSGEVSLAHNGVLFLDELPEFRLDTIEALAAVTKDGRARCGSETMPAEFWLLASANPCGCGYYGDDRKLCACSRASVDGYRSRLFKYVEMLGMIVTETRSQKYASLLEGGKGEPTRYIRERVVAAERVSTKLTLAAADRLSDVGESRHHLARMVASSVASLAGEFEVTPEHAADAVRLVKLV